MKLLSDITIRLNGETLIFIDNRVSYIVIGVWVFWLCFKMYKSRIKSREIQS